MNQLVCTSVKRCFRGILLFVSLLNAGLLSAQNCDTWLKLSTFPSYVSVGDLDIPGTQLTVEALFTRMAAYTGGEDWAGDLVSKYNLSSDMNYLLRPGSAEITTTNGHFRTPFICPIAVNKTYHVAMVYDGASLRFYRNGYLMSSVACTGNLVQNNFSTCFGLYDGVVNNTNLVGYLNEVRIWSTVRTQAELRANMEFPLPAPAGQAGLEAYYTFNSLNNKQGNPAWNGNLGGTTGAAVIGQVNPACGWIVDSCGLRTCPKGNDFDFDREVCSPLSFSYLTGTSGYNSIKWDMGDGTILSGTPGPSHTYAAYGNYQVMMMLEYSATCSDTMKKTIAIDNVVDPQLILTPDTSICLGGTKLIRTTPALSFCWSPATYLNDPSLAQPTTSAPHDITYYFTSETAGSNLITNGNFSAGNSGFTSQYNFASPNITEGQYFVGPRPENWNGGLSPCRDHTSNGGNMMMINGSPVADVYVWRQTVTVAPNTNYAFSTWLQALWPPNPAQLQFSINGKDIGTLITASLPTCTWTQFYATWNSGNTTTAVISIVNKNTAVQGNDFALDDISFAPVSLKRDSVKISVTPSSVKANMDTTVCKGSTVSLIATGMDNYTWLPATGLTNTSAPNPVATIHGFMRYIVTGTNAAGCIGKDTVDIDVFARPAIATSNDTTICKNTTAQLNTSGGGTYLWSPANGLTSTIMPNPVASPLANTKYYVKITDINTCQYLDSVQVDIHPNPTFTISNSSSVCLKDSVQLQAGGGDVYLWLALPGISNSVIKNPKVAPVVTTDYSVTITESTCNESATLSTKVTVFEPPVIVASSSNNLDCSNDRSQLMATGGLFYEWSPAGYLSDPRLPNPIAMPTLSTDYVVMGSGAGGCVSYDTVSVKVENINKGGYLMPNAFTPNNDGKNDCYGIRYWGAIQQLEFSIFNRWGERIFFSRNPMDCWDGTYKGVKQDGGIFVYSIRARTTCDDEVFRKGTFALVR